MKLAHFTSIPLSAKTATHCGTPFLSLSAPEEELDWMAYQVISAFRTGRRATRALRFADD